MTRISRFNNANDDLVNKILSADEKVLYEQSSNKPRFLAKRWSIKEALFKSDNSLNTFNQINLIDEGRKTVYEGFDISTTTEDDYYIAIVRKEA